MARQLTLDALQQLRKNPIQLPELPDYEGAETIVDTSIAPRVQRHRETNAGRISDDIFEQWLSNDIPQNTPGVLHAHKWWLGQALWTLVQWLRR